MGKILLMFFTFISPVVICAQTIEGVCLKASAETIEFVAAGISGTRWGFTTDREGRFSAIVPDSLHDRDIVFSHISFRQVKIPVAELVRMTDEAAATGKPAAVVMEESAFRIAQVEVRPGKNKIVKLNSRGTRIPSGWTVFEKPVMPYRGMTQKEANLQSAEGLNTGILFDLKDTTWIKNVEFDITSNTFDTLRMRIVVYQHKNGCFTPLMKSPVYVDVEKTDRKTEYVCDLSDENIITGGQVYIGLETVAMSEKGVIAFPIFIGGKCYYRNMATGYIEKEASGLGLQARGIVFKY